MAQNFTKFTTKFTKRLRPALLTLLSLGVGYLFLCVSTGILYTVWFSQENHAYTSQFLAFAAVCGLVFTAVSGYLTALTARRKPVLHASLFAAMLTALYALPILLVGTLESSLVLVLNVAIALSGSMIGGWLRYWQVHRHPFCDLSENPQLMAES
ncbi:MAG: hypothetical protein AAFQ40_14955 [Cyanobacteria bacterium J06623_5]